MAITVQNESWTMTGTSFWFPMGTGLDGLCLAKRLRIDAESSIAFCSQLLNQ
jgi:hypothetical protein